MNDSRPLRCRIGWHKWSENRGGIRVCRRCEAATTFGLTGSMRRIQWQKELREKYESFEEQDMSESTWLERTSGDCESDWPTLLWRAFESEHVEGLKVKHQGKWYRIEEGGYIGPQLVEEQDHD